MKNNTMGAVLFVLFITALFLVFFMFDSSFEDTITGQAVYQAYDADLPLVAQVEGKLYYYRFNGNWFESKDEIDWELREDMGTSFWTGLYYLRSYDARIFFEGKEIIDITELARNWE